MRAVFIPVRDAHQLVRHLSMILACHSLANSRLHQSRQGGKNIDGRIDLTIVELPVNVDLSFGDIASQIRNRMSDV